MHLCIHYKIYTHFRWEHYLRQYAIHKKSLQTEKEMMKDSAIKEKIQNFQEIGVSWHEVCLFYFVRFIDWFFTHFIKFDLQSQFLAKAIKTLCESRQQLMYMCIFGYFVMNNNQKEIFEMNQDNLLVATEALSRYLEQEITTDNVENLMLNLNDKVR